MPAISLNKGPWLDIGEYHQANLGHVLLNIRGGGLPPYRHAMLRGTVPPRPGRGVVLEGSVVLAPVPPANPSVVIVESIEMVP